MAALALTVLLAMLWVAFVALGYWHGGWRQIALLAAMLLSYAVLSEWAAPNGHDLSARFHWSIARATTGVALLYLLVGTFVLGFLGSFALHRPRPLGPTERALGAAMGVLNGGLLLALVLRVLRSYAFAAGRGQTLHASMLSRFLIEDLGYLLLAALLLGGIAAIAGLTVTRRDEARETASLESAATPAAIPNESQHPAPAAEPIPPPAPEPVYANAPLIDWPASPPPGIQTTPPGTHELPMPAAPPITVPEAATIPAALPLPARPQLPPRVPPPMIYPVADLIAAHAKPATRAADGASAALPVPSHMAPPSSLPSAPAATSRPARPVGPPPGAANPAFIPPTASRPPAPQGPIRAEATPERPRTPLSLPPEPPPPVVRELHPPTGETPVVRKFDVATQDTPPPVVRELDVSTQDVPIVRDDAAPAPEAIPDETTPNTDGGTMDREPPAPTSITPPAPGPTMATVALPAVVPPPLPPISAPRPATPPAPPVPRSLSPIAANRPAPDEMGPGPRTGYARVAVARQAGGRPDEPPSGQPPSQPPAPPEPLHPPLPTGPHVHPCPTCGYPVRDHARYCPNCGSRQDR